MTFTISADETTLTIFADETDRENLRNWQDRQTGTPIQSDAAMADFFEQLLANSELQWIAPETTGDLTCAPMLGTLAADGETVNCRWGFMDYQVRSVLEVLRDNGQVVFIGGRLVETLENQLKACESDWVKLVSRLKSQIADDYRATDDPDDDVPGMCLTIGFTPETNERNHSWSYQTGDNSFTGGAYGHPHWAVVSIYRDSDPAEIAAEIADQISDLVWQ